MTWVGITRSRITSPAMRSLLTACHAQFQQGQDFRTAVCNRDAFPPRCGIRCSLDQLLPGFPVSPGILLSTLLGFNGRIRDPLKALALISEIACPSHRHPHLELPLSSPPAIPSQHLPSPLRHTSLTIYVLHHPPLFYYRCEERDKVSRYIYKLNPNHPLRRMGREIYGGVA